MYETSSYLIYLLTSQTPQNHWLGKPGVIADLIINNQAVNAIGLRPRLYNFRDLWMDEQTDGQTDERIYSVTQSLLELLFTAKLSYGKV